MIAFFPVCRDNCFMVLPKCSMNALENALLADLTFDLSLIQKDFARDTGSRP